jgi:hypothetical protein
MGAAATGFSRASCGTMPVGRRGWTLVTLSVRPLQIGFVCGFLVQAFCWLERSYVT